MAAVIKIDGEVSLVGRFIRVAPLDSGFDVFVCNHRNLNSGLGTKKLNNLVKTIPKEFDVQIVDGEAWFWTDDLVRLKHWLISNRTRLGISKRRSCPQGYPNSHGVSRKRPDIEGLLGRSQITDVSSHGQGELFPKSSITDTHNVGVRPTER